MAPASSWCDLKVKRLAETRLVALGVPAGSGPGSGAVPFAPGGAVCQGDVAGTIRIWAGGCGGDPALRACFALGQDGGAEH